MASLADGIMVVDVAGRIRFANPAASALFEQSLAALVGADFGHPVRAGEVAEIELLVDGLPRVVEMRTSPGRWNGEQVVVAALRDVSARARAMAELEELARHALHDP
ncbi:MAG TPA: PAS domain-containing protein, partial [Acidimicrobiales bacterium]